jgi:hypothetical protein
MGVAVMYGYSHVLVGMLSQNKEHDVNFDVETAIRVCRGAGYYKLALSLAETHSLHDWYIRMQVEDVKQYSKALDYIGHLPFTEVGPRYSWSDSQHVLDVVFET